MKSEIPAVARKMKGIYLMLLASLFCALLILTHPKPVTGAIFACEVGDTLVYQDWPCPIKQKLRPEKNLSTTSLTLTIHESWFDLPGQADERAFCDRRGCECGSIEKKHQGSLTQSVADALYLDGSWHRYETSLAAWLKEPATSSDTYFLRKEMSEAACEVMMSQVLLRSYADNVLTALQDQVNTAQERGFNVKQPCLEGVAEACAYYDSVQLLARIKKDAAALQRARGKSVLPLLQANSSDSLLTQ